jgi:Ricin-type beta-trefoil lectin domain-like
MNLRQIRTVLLALPLTAVACAAPTNESESDAEHVDTTSEAITGVAQNGGLAGIVLVTSTNSAAVHTGTLIDPTTVLIAASALPANQDPRQVTLTYAVGSNNNPNGIAVTAADIVRHPTLDVALVKLRSTFANSQRYALDPRAPGALVGTTLRCYGFTAQRSLVHVDMNVVAGSGSSLTLETPWWAAGQMVDNGDVGVPCFDPSTWTVVGIGRSTNTARNPVQHTQTATTAFQGWLDGAQNLFGVRAQPLSRPFSLYYLRNQADWATGNCLDIPSGSTDSHAPVNQYPCHYGPAQQFYFDYRQNATYPAIVSASSGMCIDIPNASTASGTGLQQYPCHGGANQAWDLRLFNPQGSGFAYGSRVSIAANLCLSGVGGPSFGPSLNVTTATCQSGTLTNTQQRWFIRWD